MKFTFQYYIVSCVMLLLLMTPEVSYGYIDPGAGSALFQGLIAALFGATLALKVGWRHVVNMWAKIFKSSANKQPPKENTNDVGKNSNS